MKTLVAILVAALAAGCSHVQINAGSNTSSVAAGAPSAGTSVTSGSAGLQVRGGSLAAAIVIMGLAAGAVEDSREERSFPSPAALFPQYTPPAPALAPDRRVNQQDCTRPVDFSAGNLRCR